MNIIFREIGCLGKIKEAVKEFEILTGKKPNSMIMGVKAYDALKGVVTEYIQADTIHNSILGLRVKCDESLDGSTVFFE